MTPRHKIIEDIVKPIAEVNFSTVDDVFNPSTLKARRARQAVAWFLWTQRGWSYRQIAAFFKMKREGARYAVASYEYRNGYDTCRAKWAAKWYK